MELPFPEGEKLTFEIRYLISKVGEMELTFWGQVEHEGEQYYRVTAHSKYLGMWDKEDILATREELLPALVRREFNTIGVVSRVVERYDQEASRVVLDPEGEGPQEVIEKEGKLQNVILLYYLLRTMKLEEGQELDVNLPRENYQLTVGSEQEVKVPFIKCGAVPLVSDPEKFTVWITRDAEPIPVRMNLKSKLGTYLFELTAREVLSKSIAKNTQPNNKHSVR